jgi:hypothetical protein
MYIIIIIFASILFTELFLLIFIKKCKKNIPWLITQEDESPLFKKEDIDSFIKNKYDFKLGWNWRKNNIYLEKKNGKTIKIKFGDFTERLGTKSKKNPKIASFGDSFVFCRYSKNHETWQEIFFNYTNKKIMNFGVGNYGLDQIFLKYYHNEIPKSVKHIIVGFVPETLSRLLCSWKHYYEFNNIFGFKPKFILERGRLNLIQNPVTGKNSFGKINKIINQLKQKEFYYKHKFSQYKLRFPYTFFFLKNFCYNSTLYFFSILNILKINENKVYNFIIKKNVRESDFLYLNKAKVSLLKKIIYKFKKISIKRKHNIIFVVFPQKSDFTNQNRNYIKLYKQLKNIRIINMNHYFINKDINKIYLDDKYGGHLTKYGNAIVARALYLELKNEIVK